MKFRSKKHDIDSEMADMLRFKRSHKLYKLSLLEMMKSVVKPYAYRPFFMVLGYFALTQFSGIYVVVMWAVVMLQLQEKA
ncbi:hypothetical protein O3G_MSEX015488 [Manduca sexta]|uniref:Uncharacterized protein n=1 Tax=Manduca sexta TaxID=7130 RepID=A0A922D2I9_MANSE|nr:hypothetical protein O3G_MSEX015488 [Manduca sexta]